MYDGKVTMNWAMNEAKTRGFTLLGVVTSGKFIDSSPTLMEYTADVNIVDG